MPPFVSPVSPAKNEWGTTVVADIVLDAGALPKETIDLVNRTLATRLAKYKIPRQFRIADSLPG